MATRRPALPEEQGEPRAVPAAGLVAAGLVAAGLVAPGLVAPAAGPAGLVATAAGLVAPAAGPATAAAEAPEEEARVRVAAAPAGPRRV